MSEIEYEVWQKDAFGDGDAMVAGSTDLADAQHYAAVYGQDGPAWIVEVRRSRLSTTAQPSTEAVKLALVRLNDNLASAPAEADKCFVSLDDHRTILAALRHSPIEGEG